MSNLDSLKKDKFMKNDLVIDLLTDLYIEYIENTSSKNRISAGNKWYTSTYLNILNGIHINDIPSCLSNAIKMLEKFPKPGHKRDAVIASITICQIVLKRESMISGYDLIQLMLKKHPWYFFKLPLVFSKNHKKYLNIARGTSISQEYTEISLANIIDYNSTHRDETISL